MKNKNLFKNNFKFYALAFFIPVLIMLSALLANGIFSNHSILVNDLHSQYVNFLSYYRDALLENGIFYSFSKGLGGNFFGIFTYYLASPLNLLCFLFSASQMEAFVAFLILLRCGFSCAAFCWFLSKQSPNTQKIYVLAFGVLYALSSFMVVYNYQILWSDAFVLLPIIVGCWQDVLNQKSSKGFIVSFTLLLISNYYMAYMVGLFCALLFLHHCIAKFDKNTCFKTFLGCAKSAFICLGLASWVILPTLFALVQGKLQLNGQALVDKQYLFAPLQIIPKLFIGGYDSVGSISAPFIYCGAVSFVLAILSFFVKNRSRQVKIADFFVLCILTISLWYAPIYKIWHMFALTNAFPYRFGYIFIFFILWLAFIAAKNLKEISFKWIVCIFTGTFVPFGLLYIALFQEPKKFDILFTAFLCGSALFCLFFTQRKNKKIFSYLFVAIILMDTSYNSVQLVKKNYTALYYQEKDAYVQDIIQTQRILELLPKDGFYRIALLEEAEKGYAQYNNHAFKHNYAGVYHTFTSLPELAMEEILQQISQSKSPSAVNTLLGVGYVISPQSQTIQENPAVFPLLYKSQSLAQHTYSLINPLPYINWVCGQEIKPQNLQLASGIATANQLNNLNIKGNQITGNVTIDFDGQMVCSSIVSDSGWKIWANGKQVQPQSVLQNFIAFSLPKGEWEIKMIYMPKGLYFGLAVTLLTVFYICYLKARKKHKKGSYN